MDESPWPVSVQRLASHLRSLRRALDTGTVGTERSAALVVYDAGLDQAVTMLELDVATARPMGEPMPAEQRRGVEQALSEAGLGVDGEPWPVGDNGWAGAVAQRLRVWSVLRTDEAARRYLTKVATFVESLPGDDWRLEALDYLRSMGEGSRSSEEADDFTIFTGEGAHQVLTTLITGWEPASFDELLAALVIHEAQDLGWRDDL